MVCLCCKEGERVETYVGGSCVGVNFDLDVVVVWIRYDVEEVKKFVNYSGSGSSPG